MTDDDLRTHIAKMETIHGDEPIRIKIALPWATELLYARQRVSMLQQQHTEDSAALAAAKLDTKRLDWLERNPFMAYRDRDPETRKLCDHFTLVDEDNGRKNGRRGVVTPTFRAALDEALKQRGQPTETL